MTHKAGNSYRLNFSISEKRSYRSPLRPRITPDICSDSMAKSSDAQTPLMKQFWELKETCKDALLLFRMGDFYELFGPDAEVAAEILKITLTSRDRNKPNPIPMAGVPHHSVDGYIQKLLQAGKKVAIGEQLEDPSTVKGSKSIVRRGITRIFTPAVNFGGEQTDASFLAVLLPDTIASSQRSTHKNGSWTLALFDPATGETRVDSGLDDESALSDLEDHPIKHILYLEDSKTEERLRDRSLKEETLIESLPKNYLSFEIAERTLKEHFQLENLDAFIQSPAQCLGLGILAVYTCRSQQIDHLKHIHLPVPIHQTHALKLGPKTVQHLDLLPKSDGTPNLFQWLNKTRSSLGARELKRWISEPLKDPEKIKARQETIRYLSLDTDRIQSLGQSLKEVYDLERILGRVNTRLANPRDTLALGKTLSILPRLMDSLQPSTSEESPPKGINDHLKLLSDLSAQTHDLTQKIVTQQKEDAPFVSRDGGIFEKGAHDELDRLIDLNENGQKWLIELEAREREKTGIPSLKVRYNRVFGYYIEVTKTHSGKVPAHYQRKQSMVNAERFYTEELKKFEEEILTSSVKQKSLEQDLFEKLLAEIHALTAPLKQVARLLGEIDSWVALARLAEEPGFTFPVIDHSGSLDIQAGRHPLVDQMARGEFVPNDTALGETERRTLLITGPNMGGKSTVMRQVALIVILGQMGAPVPAVSARWGAFSSIYTRIGAHDAISRGQSTFMVEMSELAHILQNADEKSLIILDEIGRGTSTYDGMSVAWATLEWICNKIKARTLFATHYHELTRIADEIPVLENAHLSVESKKTEGKQHLRFLYLLCDGAANESYGIQVGQLAGLPDPIIRRAWKVLGQLEKNQSPATGNLHDPNQLSLFEASFPEEKPVEEPSLEPHPTLTELEQVNINEMTPVQALNFVVKLKDSLNEESGSNSPHPRSTGGHSSTA